jgi:hypothetical protein
VSFAPTCSTADVAALIPERCGATSGDFSGTTNPTATQVTSVIAQIAGEVMAVVGPTVDDSLTAFAKLVVATGAAAQVELSFTDQEARDTESKYEWLIDLYCGGVTIKAGTNGESPMVGGRLALLADAAAKIAAGGTPGINDPATAYGVFPDLTFPVVPVTTWIEGY